jgi:hypothetical protein
MNKRLRRAPVELDIPVQLDNLTIGQRYTFYMNNGQTRRGTIQLLFPAKKNRPRSLQINHIENNGIPIFWQYFFPLNDVTRITQYNFGPTEAAAININSFLG